MSNNLFNNPNDPLLKAGPDPSIELLKQMAQLANGMPYDIALNAAVNFMINIIRQSCPDRAKAEEVFRHFLGQGGNVLMSHYDSVTGKRKNIFPFTQVVEMPRHLSNDRKS